MQTAAVEIGTGDSETEPAAWPARGVARHVERGWSVLTDVSDHFGFATPLAVDGPGHAAVPLPVGTRLGDVTIVRMLGEGGMGRVYEGRQEGPRRSVAVKVLAAGVLTRSALRRFEFEAEALGRLRHPHIAQIHSFGSVATPLGAVPYFVMELVTAARTITEHAAAERLSVSERVALLRAVADAVAHGHANGIIHRDLKPANILVDGMGAAKVIDFGVARSTDRPPGPDATATGDVVGTLQYMSPEQLGSVADDIDVRTDVYALGLVLHELLVGRLPHDLRGAAPGEAARVLLEAGPPAHAAVESAVRLAGHAGAGVPAALAVIVCRCLQTRPADRYATAHDVAAELDRWLAGEPIEARPPRWTESAARFARRHRSVVAAAAVILTALVSAVTITSWFSLRSSREWHRADAARVVAEAREREAAARAATARRDLYRANVLLAAQARDHGSLAEARRALEAARGLLASANEAEPIEFSCLEASLDEAVVVFPGEDGAVTTVAAARDRIAIGSERGRVRIIRRDATAPPVDLAGHLGAIWGSCFTADGSLLATASADGTVRIWDTAAAACLATLEGHGSACYAVAFNADGSRLATAGRDGVILVRDTRTWDTVATLAGHEGTVYTLAFSPDGVTLASAGLDRILRLWDLPTATERIRLAHHEGRIFRVAFAPDGSQVATADEAGSTRIVSVATGHTRAVLRHAQRVNGVVFLSAGEVATAAADGLLRIWDADHGTERRRYRGHIGTIWDVAIDTDTGLLATAGADGTVRCWNASIELGPELALACSPAAGIWIDGGAGFAVGGDDAAVRSYSATTLRARGLRNAGRPVTALAATPDGDLVVSADDAGRVSLWRRDAEPSSIDAHPRRIHAVACRADGALIATAAEDRTARVFDTASGAAVTPPLRHPRRVLGVALSADGRRLATACDDRHARLWSSADTIERMRFTGHAGPVTAVAFDPEERFLATGSADATVRVWDLADGHCRMQLTGPTRGVARVTWSPDGRRIAAAALDGSVHVWDAADGSPTPVLRAAAQPVMDVAFAPDGRRLLTVTADRTVRVWGTSPAEIVRRRCEERE